MANSAFPYARWCKLLGLLIVLAGIVSFLVKWQRKDVIDWNELAIGCSWGLVFIYFSKEKQDDEMTYALKFKALAKALILTFAATHLYNYLALNWHYERPHGEILSISAYQFLALTLVIATGLFHYSWYQITSSREK